MGIYDYIIRDKTGHDLATITGARDRWWSRELNGFGSAGFIVSALDPLISADLLRPAQRDLFIYRKGVLIWGGEIVTRRTDTGTSGNATVTVTATGFLSLFDKKLVGSFVSPRTFTNMQLSTIAETIRSETQTSTDATLGIASGVTETARTGDRTYKYDTALDALRGLSNRNVRDGIDIDVPAAKQLSSYYPSEGRDLDDVVFEWGVNISTYSYIDDATDLITQAVVIGKEDGASTPVSIRNAPAFIQSDYGIRQGKIARSNVTDTATLAEWGDRELAAKQQGTQTIGINTKGNLPPFLGSYDIGDRVRVHIKYGIDDIDALYRINGISVRLTDLDEEDVNIQFGEQDDIASTYDDLEERLENLENAA